MNTNDAMTILTTYMFKDVPIVINLANINNKIYCYIPSTNILFKSLKYINAFIYLKIRRLRSFGLNVNIMKKTNNIITIFVINNTLNEILNILHIYNEIKI